MDTFGIPGTNGSDIRQSGTPIISVSGYTTLGDTDSWNPAFQRDQSYTFTQNVGWHRGRHDLRFGAETARYQLNHWQPELGFGPRGGLTFGQGPTVLKGRSAGDQFRLCHLPAGSGHLRVKKRVVGNNDYARISVRALYPRPLAGFAPYHRRARAPVRT